MQRDEDEDNDELVRAACMGDVEARNKLAPRLSRSVVKFLAKDHKSHELLVDLFQNTMADLWAKISEKQPATKADLVRLVLGMAKMAKLHARSRDAREFEHQTMLQLMPGPTPTRSPTTKLVQREIAERYLRELSTPTREVVLWRIEGGSLAQYATERGIKLRTVYSRWDTGLKQLRKRLARDNLTPSKLGL